MVADPRWLEILKASGWQTAAIAVACALIWMLMGSGVLPEPPPEYWWVALVIAIFGIVCACLAVASILSALYKNFPVFTWIKRWWRTRQVKKAVEKYIPHMTEKDREIVGYLLHKNQKIFTGSQDGGHAATLIAARFVVYAHSDGQIMHPNDVPFAIPDEVWEVLIENKDKFPYKDSDNKPYPWRVAWMAR